jgi:hypothetical protein
MANKTRKFENSGEPFGSNAGMRAAEAAESTLTRLASWPFEVWLRCNAGMLKAAEPIASGWLERRREAATAALDVMDRLSGCSDVQQIAAIQREWLDGAMRRIDSDLHAIADHAAALSHEAVSATRYAAQTSSDVVAFAVHAVPHSEEPTEAAA